MPDLHVTDFDVTVVGAGPAGSAAAHGAARNGGRVLLVDRGASGPFNLGEALPPVAGRVLRAAFGGRTNLLGSPPHLESTANRAAWGSDTVVSTDFVLDPEGHGWHLDRARFDASLRDAAEAAGATVRTRTAMRSLRRVDTDEHESPRWLVQLEPAETASGEQVGITTRVIIDATGRSALVARAVGAHRRRVDRLVAVAALLEQVPCAPDDLDRATLVEAVEAGWWYTARLPERRRVVVFLTDGDLLDAGTHRRTAGWWAHVGATRHVGNLVTSGRYQLRGPPVLAAADTGWLEPVCGPGWLATGDAATSFDPLSSLGIVAAVDFGARAGAAGAAMATGDARPASDYAANYARQRDSYLAERRAVYESERRWPTSTFWRRRKEDSAQPSAQFGVAAVASLS